ncbi:MAG: phosphatase PAP2 family protein [Candidatus Heimdallarchaeota archaeon]
MMSDNRRIKSTTLTTIMLFVIVALWGIFAAVFGIYDLEISHLFVNQSSIWGNIGADYGELPGFSLICVSICILLGSLFENKRKQKIPFYTIIVITLGSLIYFLIIQDYEVAKYLIAIGIGPIFYVPIFYQKDLKKFRKISWVILLLAILNPLIFVQIMKLLTQRIRYRNLLDNGFENYLRWYASLGPSVEYNSFPSGHTAMGWMLLPLVIAVKQLKWKNPLRILVIIAVLFVGVFVGLSRIKVGAHYASDVLFSTGAAFVYTLILHHWFYLNKPKKSLMTKNGKISDAETTE